jgi:non-heme chloroperoxidase
MTLCRDVLLSEHTAASGLPDRAAARTPPATGTALSPRSKRSTATRMITPRDGTQIHFMDCDPKDGPARTPSHRWPPSADRWDDQASFVASKGFRAVARDRRDDAWSSQPRNGNELHHYADDPAQVIEVLVLRDAPVFGFSAGGGEVAPCPGRHGTGRVAQIGLVSAIPPLMPKAEANIGGLSIDVFDDHRS